MKTITLELNDADAALLDQLAEDAKLAPGALVAEALHRLAQEAEMGDPLSAEQIAEIEAGLADIAAGRIISSDDLFRRLDEKYGR